MNMNIAPFQIMNVNIVIMNIAPFVDITFMRYSYRVMEVNHMTYRR